jgi:chemotaxis protein methyltransferase CheR
MDGLTLSDGDFRRFQNVIYRTAGIHLSHNKRAMLAARLSKRLRALKIVEYAQYLDRVESNEDEMAEMLDCVATNETRFFREQKQFDFLQNVLIPRWKTAAEARVRPRTLRVWSAGCSTGEEPYSLAMALLAGFSGGPEWDLSIVASDLSVRALDVAMAGVWSVEKASSIPEPLLKRFMLRGRGSQQGRMKAGQEIRSVIRFFRMNLNDDGYPVGSGFDLILCRNVLIYFDADSRRRVIDRFIDRLSPGAFFFIGHAETLHGVTTRVRCLAPTIYQLPAASCTS